MARYPYNDHHLPPPPRRSRVWDMLQCLTPLVFIGGLVLLLLAR